MNQSMLTSLLTSILAVVGAWLVGSGKISSADWSQFSNVLVGELIPGAITVAVILWKLLSHTAASKVLAASNVPGTSVNVNTAAAPASVTALANDNTVPNVKVAA